MILEWLPQSLLDFYEIIDFIAAENPVAAVEQGDEIERQVALLQDNRHMGRPGRVKMTRELVLVRTPYIAAYRVKGKKNSNPPDSTRRSPVAREILGVSFRTNIFGRLLPSLRY